MREDIGIRMKEYYESIPKTRLMRRTPVIIRIDGKAFHTFTRGFKRPFDEVLIKSMQETTKYLCENIQGCVLGYCQSDEISLVLVDYQRLDTSAWFDYEVQKMCSIAASMATMAFNKCFAQNVKEYTIGAVDDEVKNAYEKALLRGAMFDARVFNIPKEEVTNCIYWRQLDARKNSIQMVGQANFPHKRLLGRSCNDIQNMLMQEKGIDWNELPVYQKIGSCCVKVQKEVELPDGKGTQLRTEWAIDKNIPVFKGQDRTYIDKLFMVGE